MRRSGGGVEKEIRERLAERFELRYTSAVRLKRHCTLYSLNLAKLILNEINLFEMLLS